MADVFALRHSTLNPFLFSDVGTEANGSGLTILSMLARLGKDPWAEAAQWAGMSRAKAADALAASIARMPLNQVALENGRATASRLVDLLPPESSAAAGATVAVGRKVGWVILVFCWMNVALGIWMTMSPNGAPVPTKPAQPTTEITK